MTDILITIHDIAVDGLPPANFNGSMNGRLTGRVAFLFDGCIVSGWPVRRELFPHLYTPAAIEKRTALADSIGIHLSEQERIRDKCGRTATLWQADSDVGLPGLFSGVTHWVEFPASVHTLERTATPVAVPAAAAQVLEHHA